MASSLTATKIKDTYGQVLHVDGGVTSTPKSVYDGDGTATALKVSTTDVQVNNSPVLTDADIGSTVQAYDADLTAWSGKTAPSGTVVGTSDSQTLSNKTFSDNPTLSAGAANGVAYLNGSKVLTTGSALTFDGTNLVLGGGGTSGGFPFTQRVAVSGSPVNAYRITNGSDSTFDVTLQTGLASIGNGIGSLAFLQAGSEQMRLTSTGLGIGTSSPSSRLHVYGSLTAITCESSASHDAAFVAKTTLGSIGTGVSIGTSAYCWNVYDYSAGERMRLDSSGNLGLGVTPSFNQGGWAALSIKGTGVNLASYQNTTLQLMNNSYVTGGNYLYGSTGAAAVYIQSGAVHSWSVAPSGTAGNAISFTQAMTLDASGNLLVGNTSQSVLGERLLVNGAGVVIQSASATNRGMLGNFGGSDFIVGSYDSIALAFRTGNTERMRIDSSGNVGIGTSDTSSFGRKLLVNGTGGFNNDSGTVGIGFSKGVSATYGYIGTGDWAVNGLSAADFGISSGSSGVLAFGTAAGTERMRIDSSGNVLVGTTSGLTGWKVTIGGTESHLALDSNSRYAQLRFYNQGTIKTQLYDDNTGATFNIARGTGGVYLANNGTSWTSASDERLKENLVDIADGLNKVSLLRSVIGNYIADETKQRKPFLIAQDVQAVLPEAVTSSVQSKDDNTEYLGISYTEVIPLLVAAIKELKAELDATKAEVAALKGV